MTTKNVHMVLRNLFTWIRHMFTTNLEITFTPLPYPPPSHPFTTDNAT